MFHPLHVGEMSNYILVFCILNFLYVLVFCILNFLYVGEMSS